MPIIWYTHNIYDRFFAHEAVNMTTLREFLGLSFFISKIDKFLDNFRRNNRHLSKLQREEIAKYEVVNRRRDQIDSQNATSHQKLWEQF